MFRGAEEHYTRSNNKTRSESIEQATVMDKKVGRIKKKIYLNNFRMPITTAPYLVEKSS